MSSIPTTQNLPASVLTGASKVSTATTKTNNGITKRFVFGSEWNFKPEGVKAVIQRVRSALGAKKLTTTFGWNPEDHTWRLTCDHANSEQVWRVFFKVVENLINAESGDGWESSDVEGDEKSASRKIQHLSVLKQSDIDTAEDPTNESPELIPATTFPEKVRFYKGKIIWNCQALKLSLDEMIPDELLLRLACIVGCEFVKDLNQGKIFVGANTEEQCHRAICKLDILRKYWELRIPFVKHLFYAEELKQYKVSFKYIMDVKKRFFETTLLDNLQLQAAMFNYFNLQFAITVRCAPFNNVKSRFTPFKVGKYTAAVDPDPKDDGSREFRNYTYGEYKAPGYNPDNNAMTRYEAYIQQASADIPEAYQLQDTDQSSAQEEYVEDYTEHDHPIESVNEKIERWIPDAPGLDSLDHQTSNMHSSKPSWDHYQPSLEEHVKPKKERARTHNSGLSATHEAIASRSMSNTGLASQPNNCRTIAPMIFTPPSQVPLPNLAQFSCVQLENVPPKDNHRKDTLVDPKSPTQVTLVDLLQDSPKKTPSNNTTEIDPVKPEVLIPVAALAGLPVVATDENIAHFNFPGYNVLPPVIKGQLSSDSATFDLLMDDVFDPTLHSVHKYPVAEPDVLQAIDEVVTRKFHATMNQKAPKPNHQKNTANQKGSKSYNYAARLEAPSPPPTPRRPPLIVAAPVIDPIPEFIADINEDFYRLVESLREFKGEVLVQAEFGRVLMKRIPRNLIAPGDSVATVDPVEGLAMLNHPNGAWPLAAFTKVLTALPADISYLVEMKDPQGQPMWKSTEPPATWNVYYEFYVMDCRSGRQKAFIIEIDAEKHEARVKVRRDFGAINAHAVKRHWDFRVSATGIEAGDNIDPAYHDFAQTVMATLNIPEGSRNPMLFFEIPDFLALFQIRAVRVRRISKYRSLDTKSLLNVSEVRELEMADSAMPPGGALKIYKWFGSPDSSTWLRNFGYKWHFLWHEVSISCPKADEIFQQNKDLELGEEASWTSENLTAIDAISSMYLPACEMIKQMDGIGFYNDNNIDTQIFRHSSIAESATPQKYFFW